LDMTTRFFNVPPVRFYRENERLEVEKELTHFAKNKLGKTYANPFVLKGEMHKIFSPSDSSICVGQLTLAHLNDVSRAIEIVHRAYCQGGWAKAEPSERASCLLKAANIMLVERHQLAALIVYEAGKNVLESYADVDEAIDFLNFYAREEVVITKKNPKLVSKGAMAVISPWNFPLALACGMAASAVAAGNSVILKSSSLTPLVAQRLVDILHQGGVPQDVLIHLPGDGHIIGETLAKDSRIAGVVFTGSVKTGMSIAHDVNRRLYYNPLFDQTYPARAITEMGGKNAVIVTANADLGEAVTGILGAAFGHAGQKCSACSRVLIAREIKDLFLQRFKNACLDVKVGKAHEMATVINPVVNAKEKERLLQVIRSAIDEAQQYGGKVIVDRSAEENLPENCLGPVVIEIPRLRALDRECLAQLEIFGPVIHVIPFDTLDEALEVFNCTDFALTGGVYAQSQSDIDYLTVAMECGNIYVNRGITGARVAVEPFGGFKLSGTGPKAGGRGYMHAFHHYPVKIYEMGLPFEERGTDYKFSLCRPSKIGPQGRLPRLDKAMENIIRHFEALFQGVYGEEKEVLIKYRKWLNTNFIDFQMKKHNNRIIPGQLSYNDFKMCGEQAIFLALRERPHFANFMHLLAAVTMGVGVTVIARNAKAYNWWNTLNDFMVSGGISKQNFDVYFCTEELMVKALKGPYLSYAIVDADKEKLQDILHLLYDDNQQQKRLRPVLTPYDVSYIGHFKRYLSQYIWIRSFAVNTMRHGAPLELDINT
ncbi:MAG: aldehyde dehydrogenase family protein, partial [Pseudomonadota bacterium]